MNSNLINNTKNDAHIVSNLETLATLPPDSKSLPKIKKVEDTKQSKENINNLLFKYENEILRLKQKRLVLNPKKEHFKPTYSPTKLYSITDSKSKGLELKKQNVELMESKNFLKHKAAREEIINNSRLETSHFQDRTRIKAMKISIDLERMLKEEKAQQFIQNIQKEKPKILNFHLEKEKEKDAEWKNDFYLRKEYIQKAKERKNEEKKLIATLNKNFLKYSQYRKYHQYDKSIQQTLENEKYHEKCKKNSKNTSKNKDHYDYKNNNNDIDYYFDEVYLTKESKNKILVDEIKRKYI